MSSDITVVENAQSPVQSGADEFRMRRIILIDSYSPGGEVVLAVDGGAILTGQNGAGKTSLIRLVPVFFGELPGRVSVGTSSFAEFYLARSTSYIIFEYERRGVVCLAVLYGGKSADAYTYRFVRSAYDLSLFAVDEGKTLVTSAALPTHLKTYGVPHSRALAHDEYRAIIQGRVQGGRDAAQNRAYVTDYAFTASGSHLDRVDKIVSGMFKRKAEFRDFLRMVVDHISTKDDSIALVGDKAKIEVWPRHYEAYQMVMGKAPLMAAVDRHSAALEAAEHESCVLHAKLLVAGDHFTAQVARLRDERKAAGAELEKESETFREQSEARQAKKIQSKVTAETFEKRVVDLDVVAREYENTRIEEKAGLVEQVESNKGDRDQALARRKILLGKKDEVDRAYGEMRQAVETTHNEVVRASAQEQETVQNRHTPLMEALRTQEEAETAAATTLQGEREAEILSVIGAAGEEAAGHERAAAQPAASPEVERVAREKRGALDEVRRSLTAPTAAVTKATAERAAAEAAFSRQDKVVLEIVQRSERQQAELGRLMAHASPPEGSLLAWLREHYPGWSADVARVIDVGLLQRSDLSPELLEGGQRALYGVSLDLSHIDRPLVANARELQVEIERVQGVLAATNGELEAARRDLAVKSTAVKAAAGAVGDAEQVLARAKAAADAMETEERSAHAAVEASRKENASTAREAAKKARGRQQQARDELKKARDEGSAVLRKIKERFVADRRRLEGERDAQILVIKGRLDAAGVSRAARLGALEAECKASLAAEGVDVAALETIDAQVALLNEAIAEGAKWSAPVAQWRIWQKSEWSQRAQLEDQARKARGDEHKLDQEIEKHSKVWRERRGEMERRIKQMDEGIERSDRAAKDSERLIERMDLERFSPDAETRILPYDMSWSVDSLTAAANRLRRARAEKIDALSKVVSELKRAFYSTEGSQPWDFLAAEAATCDPDGNNPRALIEPLQRWFGERHQELHRTLQLEARKFGELITVFRGQIEEFDRGIRRFNTGMQDALEQTVVFDRISHVRIAFASTISEKAYWKPISDFVADHGEWIQRRDGSLPPESFARDLSLLMEHWDVRNGIRADRLGLIDVRGEVTENGKTKVFRDAGTLGELSSNGLSYLILTIIFVAFVRMIRGTANVRMTYAVDELGDLDRKNIGLLVGMLDQNQIDLVSACPEADLDVLMQFPHRYEVDRGDSGPVLREVEFDFGGSASV